VTTYSGVFTNAIYHFGIGEINWASGQTNIWAVLLSARTAAMQTGWAHYSDILNQLAASGNYSTGGNVMAPADITNSSLTEQFGAANTSFTASTFTASWAVVQHGTTQTTATNALLSYHDMGGAQQVINGTLTCQWGSGFVFTNAVAIEA
jgi:hypothetical protein